MSVLSTGESLLSTPNDGGGSGDGKVKCNSTDTAGYLVDKIISTNDSISIQYIPSEKALSITTNNDYEAVISPACNFPILSCNDTFNIPNYNAGVSSIKGYVNKINLPSGQISSITLFGGSNSSNNKHLYIALYGSNTDDVTTATRFAYKENLTSTSYDFDISASPMKIQKYKFYWVMWILAAESDGGDKVNAMTTRITGAGIGTWQTKAGIGIIDNPYASGSFHQTFDYTVNYNTTIPFVYVQLNIVK